MGSIYAFSYQLQGGGNAVGQKVSNAIKNAARYQNAIHDG